MGIHDHALSTFSDSEEIYIVITVKVTGLLHRHPFVCIISVQPHNPFIHALVTRKTRGCLCPISIVVSLDSSRLERSSEEPSSTMPSIPPLVCYHHPRILGAPWIPQPWVRPHPGHTTTKFWFFRVRVCVPFSVSGRWFSLSGVWGRNLHVPHKARATKKGV